MSDAARAVAHLIRAGRLGEARAEHAAAVARHGEDSALLAVGATLAMQSGDPAGAVSWLERLVARHPQDRLPRLQLASLLISLERFDAAGQACAPLRGDPDADRMAAFAALRLGRMAEAESLYRAVLAVRPDDADSWANLGNVLGQGPDADAAIQAYEHAITHRRGERGFYLNLAGLLERLEREEARIKVLRDAAAIFTADAEVQLAYGVAQMAPAPAEAEAALRRAIILAPGLADAWLSLGLLLEGQSRLDALAELVEAARPHVGAELALLEGMLALRRGDPAAAARHAATVPKSVHARRLAALKGIAAERLGDYPAAFDHYVEMNREVEAQAPVIGAPGFSDTLRAARQSLAMAGPAASPEVPSRMPVFVIGVPRSGTTLLDTLLSRLPDTRVLEEQPILQRAAASATDSGLDGARAAYWSAVERHLNVAEGVRVIDKHPFHMVRMPDLDTMFPRAPILFIERHPYDVVLSCFTTDFRLKHAMRSFTDLAEAARSYVALMDLWVEARERLDLNVHVVRYERLVAEPGAELGTALHFLGADVPVETLLGQTLPDERGTIRTASYAQVREPINTGAVARWRRFEEQMAPVIPIIRPWAERLGYEL
jgi:tetratricopeptide (TPR) repeat protein